MSAASSPQSRPCTCWTWRGSWARHQEDPRTGPGSAAPCSCSCPCTACTDPGVGQDDMWNRGFRYNIRYNGLRQRWCGCSCQSWTIHIWFWVSPATWALLIWRSQWGWSWPAPPAAAAGPAEICSCLIQLPVMQIKTCMPGQTSGQCACCQLCNH